MAKATRPLSGASQKKYFRDLFQSTEGLGPETADILTSVCEREIAQVRVRVPIPDRGKKNSPAKKKLGSESTAKSISTEPAAGDAVFDPFAFSVVVVITKEGRDGLARKLQSVASAADLKSLAKAQHVALPEGDLSADELRAAIVEGALQRIANRKAAAS
ncbi:MAG: hypothetical protein ACXWVS_13290 [Hyphomicrobium sp.]|jgi:hypothetical protein